MAVLIKLFFLKTFYYLFLFLFFSQESLFLGSSFVIADTALKQLQRVALTREHVLFGKRGNGREDKSGRKNAVYGRTSLFVSSSQALNHMHGRLDSVVLHSLFKTLWQ